MPKKASHLALIGLVALSTLAALPSTYASSNLTDIWQLAVQRDPSYAATQAASMADQELIQQARAKLLPFVAATAGVRTNDQRRASNLRHGSNHNLNEWALTLSQPILDLSAYSRYERAQHQAAAAVMAVEEAKQQLLLRVAQGYFDVLSAEDTLRSLHAQEHAIEHQLRAAERSFELGGSTITDAYEARSRLDLIRNTLIAAERDLRNVQQRLEAIIAEPTPPLAGLSAVALPAPAPANSRSWVTQARDFNLSVQQHKLHYEATQALLEAEKNERAPRLALQARTGSNSRQGLYGNNHGPRALDSSVGVELQIPIYTGGEISSRVREQQSRLQEQLYKVEQARRDATEAAQRYYDAVQSGLLQVNALSAAERSSKASLEANELAYEVGIRINIDVLNAQQQLYETQRALAQARYDTLMNGLRLKAAAGALDENDLFALNQLLSEKTPVGN